MKKILFALLALAALAAPALAQDDTKTKFYNFDDLLINGAYQKPQVLYTDARKKVKFEALLSLKRDFIKRVQDSSKDASLR